MFLNGFGRRDRYLLRDTFFTKGKMVQSSYLCPERFTSIAATENHAVLVQKLTLER